MNTGIVSLMRQCTAYAVRYSHNSDQWFGPVLGRAFSKKEGRKLKIKAVGDRGVLLELGETIDETVNRQVMELNRSIMAASIQGITETVPAFCSVLVCYDPLITDFDLLSSRLEELSKTVTLVKKSGGRLVEIPVCYGGESGPDLSFVAEHAGGRNVR